MLPRGKNINAVNSKGESALINAVKSSNAEVVALLLKNGADAKVLDKEGHMTYVLIDAYRGAQPGSHGGFGGRGGAAQAPASQQRSGSGGSNPARISPADDFASKLNLLKESGLNYPPLFKTGIPCIIWPSPRMT